MARNPVGFEVTDPVAGWNEADFDDLFVRKDCFLEGGLWGWGGPTSGELGANNLINQSSPIQTISGGTNWKSMSPRALFISSAIKTDGSLWLWGYNVAGSIGDDSKLDRSSPVQTISGGTDWKCAVSSGIYTSAIKTDGTLWTWGLNTNGGLGTNNRIERSSPVQTISGGTNWKSVSTHLNTIGIKTDGTLWIWGLADFGALGNNSITHRSSPVQTISEGTNWKQASAGWQFHAAVKTDGTLWSWGTNSVGGLGNNSITHRSSPVQTISEGTNWKQVSVSCFHTSAIKTDGTLWSWGNGGGGLFGDNNYLSQRSSPVQTVSGGTNWRMVSVSYKHTIAIKTDGTLWTWGSNADGRLGTNNLIARSSPVQTVSGGTSWRNVQINKYSTMAIREDCWR